MKTLTLLTLTRRILCAAAVGMVVFAGTVIDAQAQKYKKMPGYVNFRSLGALDERESTVEVILQGALLDIAREALRSEEPELAAILDKIELVRVNVFPLDEEQSKSVSEKTRELASQLEKKGWEVTVRVKEKDEDVYVYTKPGKKNDIEGVVVMVVERRGGRLSEWSENEFTFVNIVGNIDPADIGRLGRHMSIDGLDIRVLDSEIDKKRDRAYGRDKHDHDDDNNDDG
jgi:hypothetical protein